MSSKHQRKRIKRVWSRCLPLLIAGLLAVLSACGSPTPAETSLSEPESSSSLPADSQEVQETGDSTSESVPNSSSAPAIPESSQEVSDPEDSLPPQGSSESDSFDDTPQPVTDSQEFNRGKPNRDGLQLYLLETLTEDQYTYFYYTEDQLGLGIATPDEETVKAAVESYGYPEIEVEYRATAYPKSILDKAHEELLQFQIQADQDGEQIVMNTAYGGGDGYIHITIHEMHPALEKFLQESEYTDCFRVEVTGGEPLVNPDT